MKVLTVRQPWAGLILAGVKLVENRQFVPRQLRAGERFAIHAGAQLDTTEAARELGGGFPVQDHDRSRVLGSVVFDSAHPASGVECSALCAGDPFAFAQAFDVGSPRLAHWRLSGVRRYVTPIPARGQLGLWSPGPSLAHLIELAEQEARHATA